MFRYTEREATTLKMTDHENIVKFIGFEQIENILCNRRALITEYCASGDLQTLIDSKPNGVGSMEFFHICADLVNAIKHLHEKSIVHRDIKPANILISTRVDGRNIYKLADFGGARVLMANERYGSLYGTFEYIHPDIFTKYYYRALDILSPKQWFNDIHELWSIGVTLYEVAVGQLPFNPKNGRDIETMFRMISKKQHEHISAKEDDDGQIKWSTQLPDNCLIEKSMKQNVTPILAGLLNVRFLVKM